MCPDAQIQKFSIQPHSADSQHRDEESQPYSLPFYRKCKLRPRKHSPTDLDLSASGLVPLHPANIVLALSLCLGIMPLWFQGLVMISSCWGTGLLLLSVWLLQATTCLNAQAESLVLNQNLPLHICTVTMRTFHPKLISYSSYEREAVEGQSGERFFAFPFTDSSHSRYCVRFHLVLILYENSFLASSLSKSFSVWLYKIGSIKSKHRTHFEEHTKYSIHFLTLGLENGIIIGIPLSLCQLLKNSFARFYILPLDHLIFRNVTTDLDTFSKT